MKESVLKTPSCGIAMAQGNNGLSERNRGEDPVLRVCLKLEVLDQTHSKEHL